MSQTNAPHEQRDDPRLPKEALVTVAKLEYPMPADAESTGVLKNIAGGGVCIIAPNDYPSGTRLSLQINLKGWRRHIKSVASIIDGSAAIVANTPLTAVAEVTWSAPLSDGENHEIGVKFLDIYEDEYNALKKYLENLAEYSTP